MIPPLENNAEERLFEWIHASLNENGALLLELWSFENILGLLKFSPGELRLWEELPELDPWQFCLSTIATNDGRDISWQKKFVGREANKISSFGHIIRKYSNIVLSEKAIKPG